MKKHIMITIVLAILSMHGIVMSSCCFKTICGDNRSRPLSPRTHDRVKQHVLDLLPTTTAYELAGQGTLAVTPIEVYQDGTVVQAYEARLRWQDCNKKPAVFVTVLSSELIRGIPVAQSRQKQPIYWS